MRNAVTLEEAKAHLRVETTAEDTLIGIYINAASRAAEHYTGLDLEAEYIGDLYSSPYAPDEIPATIKQAVLLLIGHFYANREAVASQVANTVPLAAEWLLNPHRKPGTYFAVIEE